MLSRVRRTQTSLATKKSPGFTLVELLVVIGIIGILAGLLIPTLRRIQERAQRVQCLSQLREIGKLCMMYSDDVSGALPIARKRAPLAFESYQVLYDWDEDLPPTLVICPASTDQPAIRDDDGSIVLTPDSTSYAYLASPAKSTYSGAVASDESIANRSVPANHRRGMNVAYSDGRAQWITRDLLPPDRDLPLGLVGNEEGFGGR